MARGREQFLARFLLPLVEGGEVHVGPPLGFSGIERLLQAPAVPQLEARLQGARLVVARELQVRPVPPALDETALRLAVATHDLLFLHHPDCSARAAPRIVESVVALTRLPATCDADELVARHSLLHLLPTLGRYDVRVTFWAGRREFHGQVPPARLSAWPRLRRVREERWRVACFAEAASDQAAGARALLALLAASPLTDLLNPSRLDPPLDLAVMERALAEPEVCRSVAYHYLEEGLERTGGAIAQAVIALLGKREAGTSAIRFALEFVCHLHLCLLAGGTGTSSDPAPELIRAAGRGDSALRDFVGLYAAVHRVAPALAAPADVRDSPSSARHLTRHAEACALACGTARSQELSGLVDRFLVASEQVPSRHAELR